jgi:hypothetical protein
MMLACSRCLFNIKRNSIIVVIRFSITTIRIIINNLAYLAEQSRVWCGVVGGVSSSSGAGLTTTFFINRERERETNGMFRMDLYT